MPISYLWCVLSGLNERWSRISFLAVLCFTIWDVNFYINALYAVPLLLVAHGKSDITVSHHHWVDSLWCLLKQCYCFSGFHRDTDTGYLWWTTRAFRGCVACCWVQRRPPGGTDCRVQVSAHIISTATYIWYTVQYEILHKAHVFIYLCCILPLAATNLRLLRLATLLCQLSFLSTERVLETRY